MSNTEHFRQADNSHAKEIACLHPELCMPPTDSAGWRNTNGQVRPGDARIWIESAYYTFTDRVMGKGIQLEKRTFIIL